jgi:hypothetical protein
MGREGELARSRSSRSIAKKLIFTNKLIKDRMQMQWCGDYLVVTEPKNRGVQDILIACVDCLKGFPETIEAVYPHAAIQLCIVHRVRNSLNYVSWNMREEVVADLRRTYTCSTVDEAEQRLSEFEDNGDLLSADQPVLASKVVMPHCVLRLSARDPKDHLHKPMPLSRST